MPEDDVLMNMLITVLRKLLLALSLLSLLLTWLRQRKVSFVAQCRFLKIVGCSTPLHKPMLSASKNVVDPWKLRQPFSILSCKAPSMSGGAMEKEWVHDE